MSDCQGRRRLVCQEYLSSSTALGGAISEEQDKEQNGGASGWWTLDRYVLTFQGMSQESRWKLGWDGRKVTMTRSMMKPKKILPK